MTFPMAGWRSAGRDCPCLTPPSTSCSASATRPSSRTSVSLAPDQPDRSFVDAHGAQSARDSGAVDPIAVPYHITRSPIPNVSVIGRICCDVDPDGISAMKPHDDKPYQQSGSDGRDNEAERCAIPGWVAPVV